MLSDKYENREHWQLIYDLNQEKLDHLGQQKDLLREQNTRCQVIVEVESILSQLTLCRQCQIEKLKNEP